MTQIEILELAHGAALDQWAIAREKNKAAEAEGRPNSIYKHREDEFWEKLMKLEEMMRTEREAIEEMVRRAKEAEA